MLNTQSESVFTTLLLTTFFVRDALYGLDASGVQEVIRVKDVTPVSHATASVVGVINLRGKIVTLLDLGMILGFDRSVVTRDSRIFIIEDRNEFLGILVDKVAEVIELEAGMTEDLPINVPPAKARFFQGVCRSGGHVIALLNSSEVLNENI